MATEYFMFPASFAQQRLWFLDQMMPGTAFYNMSKASRFTFSIHADTLKKTVNEIIRRHESLRTTFRAVNGQPYQVVASSMELDVPVHDLSHLDRYSREAAANEIAHADALRPFNLSTGPLIRVSLIRMARNDCVLLLSMHHIISDVWSVTIFFSELSTLYEAFLANKPHTVPDLPLQYADYAVWQLEYLKGSVLQQQINYWKDQLAGLTPLDIPLDKKRPAFQTFNGAHILIEIDTPLTQSIKSISHQQNVTLFMTLLSAFIVLLHRYSGQRDIVVGAPIAGRNEAELEQLIGFFVNSIIIRTKLSPALRFEELAQKVKAGCLSAFAHGDLPFEKLVEELHPHRDFSRNPLFQVLFQMAAAKDGQKLSAEKNGMDVKVNTSKFDLTLSMAEEEEKLIGYFEYNTDLFFPETIQRMIAHYLEVLKQIVVNPSARLSEIDIMGNDERNLVLKEWNQTARDYSHFRPVHEMIAGIAAREPFKTAIYSDNNIICYGELVQLANRLANFLVHSGVGPESAVAVCMDRSINMVICHLAVLISAAAFVPLDPAYPDERLAYMLDDVRPTMLLTEPRHARRFNRGDIPQIIIEKGRSFFEFPDTSPAQRVIPTNRAYVMYTSGSTGQPKGVEISHGGLANMVLWNIEAYRIQSLDQCMQMATPAYDAYVYELFPALVAGATVFMVDDFSRTSSLQLKRIILERQITVAFLPTAVAETLIQETWPHTTSLRLLGTAGEKLKVVPSRPLPFNFFNLYGPTENTVIASWNEVQSGSHQQPPIGKPVSNTQLYILDESLNPVPVGVTGELFVGGNSLARGYVAKPALTAEKFIPDPFGCQPGSRLYRTGDRARYLPDGNVDFIGRADHQIKLRGFRIELEEIEKRMLEHPAVAEAAVMPVALSPSDTGLAAYVAIRPGNEISQDVLKHFIKHKLPAFMVPSLFVFLDALPKSFSGKIDRKALPQPVANRGNIDEAHDPVSKMEKLVSTVWRQYLPVERVEMDANFFDMGGHSLMMAQIHFRLRESLHADIALIDLFQYPTIRSLSRHLESLVKESAIPAQL